MKCLVILAILFLGEGAGLRADTAPDFKVTIIAVTEFSDPSLKEQGLIDGINKATIQLKSFFENNFHTNPEVFTVGKETSGHFLRTWLVNTLPVTSRGSIHLIFVLTHGFAYKTAEQDTNKSDLFLATSDTVKETFAGVAVKGSEFIDAFRLLPKRTTVLLFLDTCGSGAIDSDALKATLQHDPDFASRVFILAASMQDESAYSARFSQILASL